jgi:site-specific DNA recombinase
VKAAAYLRVSSEEQRERQTIETQRQFAERYFAQRGVVPVRYYVDDGVSGTVPLGKRPDGAEMLRDAGAGVFDSLFVYKVDRLGREAFVTMQAAQQLADAGVVLQSMTESIDNRTPHGRLSLVMLSGVAGFERDNLVERSIEGTNRLAREGAWLGGIVPFGYVVLGSGRHARLATADEPIPGLGMSEADVVRLIYRLAAEDRLSCQRIADRLNDLGVPTVYVRDERTVKRGKRTQRTSGLWRAGRVRNLITSTTYKGLHRYGKRSTKERELIEREVPAIVEPEIWHEAQQTLRKNMVFSGRNAKHRYLLRGLITCGCCGLTYCGASYDDAKGNTKTYYTCNAKTQYRGIYGKQGRRCPSKAVPGRLEDLIWADIDEFRRNPGPVIDELAAQIGTRDDESRRLEHEVAELERALAGIASQRDVIIGLFRRGRIDADALDRQLDQIAQEEEGLRADLDAAKARAADATEGAARLRTAEDLLLELHRRQDEEPTWEVKRQLVELLVVNIRVDTVAEDGKAEAAAEVTYAFTPAATRTGRGSSRQCWEPGWKDGAILALFRGPIEVQPREFSPGRSAARGVDVSNGSARASMQNIGFATIAESPRDDVIPAMRPYLPSDARFAERGCLDGLSQAEIEALGPESGEVGIVARLKAGGSTLLSHDKILPRMQQCVDELIRTRAPSSWSSSAARIGRRSGPSGSSSTPAGSSPA